MEPIKKELSIYDEDVVNHELLRHTFPNGCSIETIFSPYLKKMFKKNNTILRCEINKFKRRFGITSNLLDPVKDILGPGIVLAGGKLIDWVNNKTLEESNNDYDLFLSSHAPDFIYEVQKKIKSENWSIASSLAHLEEYSKDNFKLQLVWKINCNEEDVIEQFDIRACAICTDGINVYWVKDAIRDSKNKKITMLNPRGNLQGLYRIAKYINKGFEIAIPDLAFVSIRFLDNIVERKPRQVDFLFDRNIEFDRLAAAADYDEALNQAQEETGMIPVPELNF